MKINVAGVLVNIFYLKHNIHKNQSFANVKNNFASTFYFIVPIDMIQTIRILEENFY